MAQEVDQLLRALFHGPRKAGRVDLEAIEMAVSAMHQAGAAVLTELLQLPAPPPISGP